MNEKQLKKMDNREEPFFQEKEGIFQGEDSKIAIAEWTFFGLALGFVVVVVGFFFWNKYYGSQKNVSALQSQEENINNN